MPPKLRRTSAYNPLTMPTYHVDALRLGGVRNWIATHLAVNNGPMWSTFPAYNISHPESKSLPLNFDSPLIEPITKKQITTFLKMLEKLRLIQFK